ncbi:MAG: tetrahydrofolate dehydrogenase/cyclohydrolase catalytic domain-containing protein [Clostridium sp.]|uniref:bifunctional 5,10-methylenetetrahydrofolate dehydrogenase/5,10-methenyltetrahydrofolate cyclohydrolase n=1 Tax=Clostridium sp. TaxID=1506 RepID=UPI003035DFCC
MGIKINGKELALQYKKEIKETILQKVKDGKRYPTLASVMVGDDGGSVSYTKNQEKISEELGICYRLNSFMQSITEEELINEIKKLNEDSTVDGIILQLPLPSHLDEDKIVEHISGKKDVDGLTDINLGRFYKGKDSFIPCTARSILELINSQQESIKGKNVVVIGRSNIVGKPVSYLLVNENATVTMCHSQTANVEGICKKADILVSAIGRPGYITKDFVKDGAMVIDVGTTMVEGKVKGDVDFQEVIEIADFVSPVPGGVGAVTTTMLMKNTLEAWIKNVQ